MTRVSVDPLDGEGGKYASCFAAYAAVTDEYEAMFSMSVRALGGGGVGPASSSSPPSPSSGAEVGVSVGVVDDDGGRGTGQKRCRRRRRRPRVLSVGPGTGKFDLELFRRLGWTPELYVAVEPNPTHAGVLRGGEFRVALAALAAENEEGGGEGERSCVNVNVVEEKFTVDSPTLERLLPSPSRDCDPPGNDRRDRNEDARRPGFDVILMAHCAYHLPRPMHSIMRRCRDDLLSDDDGVVLIYVQTEECVTRLCREFHPRMNFATPLCQDYLLTDDVLLDELDGAVDGMRFTAHRAPSRLSVGGISRERLELVLSFILQTDVTKLPDDLRGDILTFVRESLDEDGGRLRHDSALIVCKTMAA